MAPDTSEGDHAVQEGMWNGRPTRYRPNRIIVQFNAAALNPDTSLDQLMQGVVAAIPGGQLIRLSQKSGRAVFAVAASTDIIALATALSAREDVEYAEPDLVDSTA